MSAGTPIQNFEKATTIPDGSLHLVEMGDGSGTKTVTQETLVEETGKALKIGDMAELQTEAKESLVAAINEAAQSGGGGTPVEVDVLDTQEEIEANTEAGKAAGALGVKEMFAELNDNLQFPDGVNFYPDVQNGVRGYNTDPQRGADTFHPFNSSGGVLTIPSIILSGSSRGYRNINGSASNSIKIDVKNYKSVSFGSVSGSASITLDAGSAQAITANKIFDISGADLITIGMSCSSSASQSDGGICSESHSATLNDICIS